MASENTEKENAEMRLLVRRVLEGDECAFAEIFIKWRPYVRSVVWNYFPNAERVDDVVAEVFYPTFHDAIVKLGDAILRSPKGYLTKIAVTRGINERRRTNRENSRLGQLPPGREFVARDDPAKELESRESERLFQLEFDKLPPREREAVVLREVYSLTYEEIAEVMGASLGSVKGWIHRGRSRLQDALGPIDGEK